MERSIVRGQVGLVLLVIMGVVVSLVLSIASRSLSDTVLSRQEKESSAAFSLAETGVENALSALSQNPDLSTEVSVDGLKYKISNASSYEMYVKELDSAYLDLNGAVDLIVKWTKEGDATEDLATCTDISGGAPSALEITAITSTGIVTRNYYNAYDCSSMDSTNGFSSTGVVDGGASYRSQVTYSAPPNSDIVRIRPIYSGATIMVTGSGLPKQQYVINSQATGGDAQKEIEVRRGLDAPASVFDFAVFAGGTIVK